MNIVFITLGVILAVTSIILYIFYRKSYNYSIHTASAIVMIASILLICCYFLEIDKAFKPEIPAYTQPTSTTRFEFYQNGRPLKKEATSKPTSSHQQSNTVYITRKGTKYHYDINCGDNEFYECELSQAINRGLEPCKRCVK